MSKRSSAFGMRLRDRPFLSRLTTKADCRAPPARPANDALLIASATPRPVPPTNQDRASARARRASECHDSPECAVARKQRCSARASFSEAAVDHAILALRRVNQRRTDSEEASPATGRLQHSTRSSPQCFTCCTVGRKAQRDGTGPGPRAGVAAAMERVVGTSLPAVRLLSPRGRLPHSQLLPDGHRNP
jgi:hypothetical protein